MRFWPSTWNDSFYLLVTLGLIVGFILTVVSSLQMCSGACVQLHLYRFFGYNFETLGFMFFAVAGALHYFARKIPFLSTLVALMVAAAVGNELRFIYMQGWIIEQWCPICLSIAAAIGFLALVYLAWFFYELSSFNQVTGRVAVLTMSKGLATIVMVALGFFIAVVGVAKPEKSFAEGIDGDEPFFGNKNSPIEVFIITDWFCPACEEMESEIAKAFPKMTKHARVYFVDYAVHAESLNFIPYSMSFMVKNKDKYLELRHELHKLAKKTKTPCLEDIEKAIEPLEVTYQPLNFADVHSGINFSEGIVKTFNVKATPTVVIANRKNLESKKLVGKEITADNISKTLKAVRNGD